MITLLSVFLISGPWARTRVRKVISDPYEALSAIEYPFRSGPPRPSWLASFKRRVADICVKRPDTGNTVFSTCQNVSSILYMSPAVASITMSKRIWVSSTCYNCSGSAFWAIRSLCLATIPYLTVDAVLSSSLVLLQLNTIQNAVTPFINRHRLTLRSLEIIVPANFYGIHLFFTLKCIQNL